MTGDWRARIARMGAGKGGGCARQVRRASFIVALALLAACSDRSNSTPSGLHNKRNMPGLLGQNVLSCEDGGKVDVDFLDKGLRMAVTWLPGRATEVLRARSTGSEFVGPSTRVSITGGTTIFEEGSGRVRRCHRQS